MKEPTLDPYYVKLERFELFSTNQCYYLVGCDKHNTSYRVLKMDRTLIERPPEAQLLWQSYSQPQPGSPSSHGYDAVANGGGGGSSSSHHGQPNAPQHHRSASESSVPDQSQHHTAKPTLRPLRDFLSEDPNVYTQEEIKEMLDMINDGNRQQPFSTGGPSASSSPRNQRDNPSGGASGGGVGGLKPMVKAYGVVGFIRFLDCYYLTLITKRSKVGSLGAGHGIYTIKNTETIALRPAQGPQQHHQPGAALGPPPGGPSSYPAPPPIPHVASLWSVSGPGGAAPPPTSGGGGSVSGSSSSVAPYYSDDPSSAALAAAADPSSVLLSMWNRGKRSVGLGLSNREIAELRYQGLYQVVDMQKNFYFSYTYDLTRSLQENFLATTTQPFPPPPCKEMYSWNHFLTQEFEACLDPLTSFYWVMPLIHGAYVQRKVIDYGKSLNLVLLARRSRHFAGTRYLKRGVSEEGKVANDVEHEQIVHDESMSCASGVFSSYLQMRGSIPTFWTQESSVTMPKPPIEINRVDPTYSATQSHFEDLLKRYSYPIIVLDLVKQSEKREREVRVGNEFRHAVDYINQSIDDEHKIRYCALDYSHISKHRNLDVSASLNEVSTWAVNQTGFFCSAPKWKILPEGVVKPFTVEDGLEAARLSKQLGIPVFPMEQSGILRTNCIDCLDRTNVAQFSAGVDAIAQQLVVMGIRTKSRLDPSSNIVRVLIDMYVDIGDSIALQYGGSEAHKKVTATKTESVMNIPGPIGKHKELLTSIRRYYSNAFTDRLKQDAMNLFLGYYIPYRHSVPLWELETDFYLHNFQVIADKGSMYSMTSYRKSFGVDWDAHDKEIPVDHRPIEMDNPVSLSQKDRLGPSSSRAVTDRSGELKPFQDESHRISIVRRRCRSQNETLSRWWKEAIQSYIQSRMWFQIGQGFFDTTVSPRFDRLYQPEKLSQFDRFFTRGWATPVRRSHIAQQSDGPEVDIESGSLIRLIHEDLRQRRAGHADATNASDKENGRIGAFIEAHGLEPHFETYLDSFLSHAKSKIQPASSMIYLGSDKSDDGVRQEYIKYVAKPDPMSRSYDAAKVNEFKACLHDVALLSDNVTGIHELSESAHIGGIILSGPYKGLSKEMSAIEVSTAIHGQLSAFQSERLGKSHAIHQDARSNGRYLAELELERQGLGTEGVMASIREDWDTLMNAEMQYRAIVDGKIEHCRRSDLTTGDSLGLYASACDPSVCLSGAERNFLTGEPPEKGGMLHCSGSLGKAITKSGLLLEKAKRLGVSVLPSSDIAKRKMEPLFQYGRVREVPPGWEQINEDMFAKRDNKFMVFNGAGIDSWSGAQQVTKIAKYESILMIQ